MASRPAWRPARRPRSEGFLPGETFTTWTESRHGQMSSLQVGPSQQAEKMARSQWHRPQS